MGLIPAVADAEHFFQRCVDKHGRKLTVNQDVALGLILGDGNEPPPPSLWMRCLRLLGRQRCEPYRRQCLHRRDWVQYDEEGGSVYGLSTIPDYPWRADRAWDVIGVALFSMSGVREMLRFAAFPTARLQRGDTLTLTEYNLDIGTKSIHAWRAELDEYRQEEM